MLESDRDAMENFLEVIEVTEYFFLVQLEFNLKISNIIELDLLYAVCSDAVCKFALTLICKILGYLNSKLVFSLHVWASQNKFELLCKRRLER